MFDEGCRAIFKEDCRSAVRRDHGVDRHGRGLDRCDVGDANWCAVRRGFDDEAREPGAIVDLRSDETKDELMVCLIETRGVDDVRCLNPINEIKQRHPPQPATGPGLE